MLYQVLLIIAFICTMDMPVMATSERIMVRQNGDITYYEIESNNFVFAEQYQLQGVIEGVNTTATHVVLMFSGDVRMIISGDQWCVSTNNSSRLLTWQVTGLLVRVSRWEDKELDHWGSIPTTYEHFAEIANEVAGKSEVVKIALRLPKLVFTEIGDLFVIEGDQAVLKHTGKVMPLKPATAVVTDEPQVSSVFDLQRAQEIVDGTVASQIVEKVTIYNKWMESGSEDRMDVAGVFDKESDIASLIPALKQTYVTPESKDPLIKPGNWWSYELRFKCKDHRDAVLSIYVVDGCYEMIGHSNPGEKSNTLLHQVKIANSSNKSPRCFIAQNLLIGKWLEAHGLPFREGTRLGIGTTPDDEKRVHKRASQLSNIETSVPVLVNALEDKDDHIRCAAECGLARLGQAASSASPQLVKMLGDSHSHVREMAIEALTCVDPSNKTASEIKKLNNDTDYLVRQKVKEALKRMADQSH